LSSVKRAAVDVSRPSAVVGILRFLWMVGLFVRSAVAAYSAAVAVR